MELCGDLLEDAKGGLHVVGSEENPAETDDVEGDQYAHDAAKRGHFAARGLEETWEKAHACFVDGESCTVQCAPKDEAKGGTVPKSAEEHGDEEVDVLSDSPLAIAAQGDVQIVFEPRGEGDVPASPELRDAGRLVRRVEVYVEAEAQEEGDPDSHIRIAREVAVYLQGVAVYAHEVFHASIEQGCVEDTVDKVQTDIVRDDALLEESTDNEVESFAKAERCQPGGAAYLRDKVPCTDNGSSD